jgi:hypothetical protein
METLENTLLKTHDWAIDRIHSLCEIDLEDAYSVQCEFAEWLDPNTEEHDVFSLEFIGDADD